MYCVESVNDLYYQNLHKRWNGEHEKYEAFAMSAGIIVTPFMTRRWMTWAANIIPPDIMEIWQAEEVETEQERRVRTVVTIVNNVIDTGLSGGL
jgi:hypothetical protein